MGHMTSASGGGTPTKAEDADGNTKVQVEESADENKIRFDTAGSERMIIDENGKVGIGTSSPSAPLHVKSTEATSFSGLGAVAIIESTDASNPYGPSLNLFRNSASPADGDHLGMIRFTGQNSNGDEHMYAQIFAKATDVTNLTEDAELRLQAIHSGGEKGRIDIGADVTINGNTANSDFMVHGQSVYALFVDASANSIGIGTGSPVATLDVASGKTFRNTRLLTVGLTSATTLTEADHAGRYVFVTGSGTVITLPDNQAAGVHFSLLSNDGNGFTLRTGSNSSTGDNMNGAQTDITVAARKGVTCISTGTDYVVIGA